MQAWRTPRTSCAWRHGWVCRRPGSGPPATTPEGTGGPTLRTTVRPVKTGWCAASLSTLEVAASEGVGIVLEAHSTSTLDSVERVKRVIERTGPGLVRVNIDTVNFVRDLPTAFDPTPMINEYFDVLGPHCSTAQVKDFYLEERFVVHISETIPGTGAMDLDTVLRRTADLGPDMYAVIEHLPLGQIAQAKRHLTERAAALGIEVH